MQSIDIWNQIRNYLLKHIISVCSYLELSEEILDPGKYLRIKKLREIDIRTLNKVNTNRVGWISFCAGIWEEVRGKLNIIG